MDYLLNIIPAVAVGLQVTLKIFVITIVLSLPLGILMSIARISSIKPLSRFMYMYIYIMRGTPLMLQILFIYYGLPFIIEGLRLSDFPADTPCPHKPETDHRLRPQLCGLLCRNFPRWHSVYR